MDVAAQQVGAQHRHECESKHQGTAEREHDDHRHGFEHFPLDALEREDGQIDDGDDQHPEEHRVGDFLGGPQDFPRALFSGEPPAQGMLSFAQVTDDVFNHHHRAVDDQAEVHGTEAHQVA